MARRRLRPSDVSVALRLLSAGWSAAIVVLIAAAYGPDKAEALAAFFTISLVAVVSAGFSSFTLSRHAAAGRRRPLMAIGLSSAAIFALLEALLVPGPLAPTHAGIAATFLLREVLSCLARRRARTRLAVILRDHLWRAALSAGLLARAAGLTDAPLEPLFLAASGLAAVLEAALILRLPAMPPPRREAPAPPLLSIAGFDLLGKLQSLSLAATPIYIAAHEPRFGAALVTMFVLVDRAARPLGLIVSQAILDVQRDGTGRRNFASFLGRFLRHRRLHFAGGLGAFAALLAALMAVYGVTAPPQALAAAILFHAYAPVFNVTNAYVVLNRGARVLALRVATTLGVTGALILAPQIGLAPFLATVLACLVAQDLALAGAETARRRARA